MIEGTEAGIVKPKLDGVTGTEVKAEYAKIVKEGAPIKSVDAAGNEITLEKGQEGYEMHANAKAMSLVSGKPVSETIHSAMKIDANIKEIAKIRDGIKDTAPAKVSFWNKLGFGKKAEPTTSPTPAASPA